jgi:hypothetical protein
MGPEVRVGTCDTAASAARALTPLDQAPMRLTVPRTTVGSGSHERM